MNQIYQDKQKTITISPEEHFNALCKEYDLKPELKDIYLIAGKVIISVDGYRKIARRSCPDYYVKVIVVSEGDKVIIDGNEVKAEITFKKMNKDNILGAYAIGSRKEDGELTYKYVEFADFYVPGVNRDGVYKPSTWDKIPVAMISKVAESTVLRMLCPELGGTYAAEEFVHIDEQPKKLVTKKQLSDDEMLSKTFTSALDKYLKDGESVEEVLEKIKSKYVLTKHQEDTILNLK